LPEWREIEAADTSGFIVGTHSLGWFDVNCLAGTVRGKDARLSRYRIRLDQRSTATPIPQQVISTKPWTVRRLIDSFEKLEVADAPNPLGHSEDELDGENLFLKFASVGRSPSLIICPNSATVPPRFLPLVNHGLRLCKLPNWRLKLEIALYLI
jgi:hypothetical protein